MILYACFFALGFAAGLGAGAYQASIYLFTRKDKKESTHD